jgi:predicted dehydrogenase
MAMRIWRGGMIGAGAWSNVQLDAWADVENAEIVALTDRHPERRTPVVDKYKIPLAFNDFEVMLDEVKIDFVDICTRPYSHATLTKLAADRGLPVLCQKPFCRSVHEAQEVAAYCKERKVPLMVNENFRWQVWFRTIKHILETGQVGQVFFAKIYRRSRLTLPSFNHNQTYFTEMPELLLYEVGTHLLDVSRFLFGEPESVYCRLHHISPEVIGEDFLVITLAYPDMTELIHDSWASVPIPGLDRPAEKKTYYPRIMEIEGTYGTLRLNPDGQIRLYTDHERKSWPAPEDVLPKACATTQQHFIDCLENNEEFETSAEETIKTMALVYACYKSAEESRVVRIEEMYA